MKVALKNPPAPITMGRHREAPASIVLCFCILTMQLLSIAPALALDLEAPLPMKLNIDIHAKTTQDYRSLPVNLRSLQSKEPLVPISQFGIAGESIYKKEFPQAEPEPRVRLTVARKLQAANLLLKTYGVELYVLDGYRPLALQQALWRHFLEKAKTSSPKKDPESLKRYAARYCSNPENYNVKNSGTWPSHITGGAIDLTLRKINSEELEMGGSFDEDSDISHTDYCEHYFCCKQFTEHRKNRRLLYNAMHAQGFENYPFEWWHYDYGNQSWSMNFQPDKNVDGWQTAFYGPAKDK